MGQQHMELPDPPVEQLAPKGSDSRTCIEDQDPTVGKDHLDARGVSSVTDRLPTGRGDRPATAPDPQLHHVRQKIVTVPTSSSACANSGKAVTSTSRETPSMLVIRRRSWAARRS